MGSSAAHMRKTVSRVLALVMWVKCKTGAGSLTLKNRANQSLARQQASNVSRLWFACGSRSYESPLLANGLAVQYVHIPKCGGTTIQTSMRYNLQRQRSMAKVNVSWNGERCTGTRPERLEPGSFYCGHVPIGWCALTLSTPRPLYIVSLRDPYELAVSLYDYYATCQHCWLDGHEDWTFIKFVKYIQGREIQLERVVAAPAYFERLLETNDTKAWILASQPQYNFLVPADCDRPSLAIAIANLLKCDIVINTDQLRVQLVAQLRYHAPYLKSFHLVVKNTLALNANHSVHRMRTKQVLGPAIRDRLLNEIPSLQFDIDLYSVAQRIADIRTNYALRGQRNSVHRLPRLHERSCDLALDNARLASRVHTAQMQQNCIVP